MDRSKLIDKEWVIKHYVKGNRNISDFAKKFKCSEQYVRNTFKNKLGLQLKKKVDNPKLYDEVWLSINYTDKKRSAEDIATELGVNKTTVIYHLKKHSITLRNFITPAMSCRHPEPADKKHKYADTLGDKDWLYHQYVTLNKNTVAIANELNSETRKTNSSTVSYYIRKYGLQSRVKRSKRKYADTIHNATWLQQKYLKEGRTTREIAKIVGCSNSSIVSDAIRSLGVNVLSSGEARTGRQTKKRIPIDKAEGLTLLRRARELCPIEPCVICGKVSSRNAVNHKDRNRKNFNLENLERICTSCHAKQHRLEEAKLKMDFEKKFGCSWMDLLLERTGQTYMDLHLNVRKQLLRKK